jgi:hypothetical protein
MNLLMYTNILFNEIVILWCYIFFLFNFSWSSSLCNWVSFNRFVEWIWLTSFIGMQPTIFWQSTHLVISYVASDQIKGDNQYKCVIWALVDYRKQNYVGKKLNLSYALTHVFWYNILFTDLQWSVQLLVCTKISRSNSK